jgi:hypothetical protein
MSEPPAALRDPGFLRAMLNLVIPPEGRMPGAGDLDLWPVVAAPLSQNAAASAALAAGLEAVRTAALAREPGGLPALAVRDALDLIQAVAADHPAFMPALARSVVMAYYQQPAVLIALGEPARPPFPDGFTLEPISPESLALLGRRAQRGGGA